MVKPPESESLEASTARREREVAQAELLAAQADLSASQAELRVARGEALEGLELEELGELERAAAVRPAVMRYLLARHA